MAQIIPIATAPVAGTNEVQRVAKTGTPTAGRFKLKMGSELTDWVDWDATATEVRDAVRGLVQVGSGGVTASGGPLPDTPVDLTAAGRLVGLDIPLMTIGASEVTGGGFAVTTQTPGVRATLRGHGKGTVAMAEDTGLLYVNTGTATVPVWKRVVAGQSLAIADLVHAVGTADGTVQDVSGAFDQTILNNNFKELSEKVNAILAAMRTSGEIAT